MNRPAVEEVAELTTTVGQQPHNVQNELVCQKNYILDLVNKSTDADEFEGACQVLAMVAGLWRELGYGYKVAEVRTALYAKCAKAADAALEMRDSSRKNSSQWSSWNRESLFCRTTCNHITQIQG